MVSFTANADRFDFAPHPGRILQRELVNQSISQAQLAARTGLSTKHINLVIKGTAPISPEVAIMLEQVLGAPAETWLQLEAAFQTHQARVERQDALAGFVPWASAFPRQILIERGVIASADGGAQTVEKLLHFFGVASPAAYEKTWLAPQASYKRSQLHSIDANLTALWIRLSELQAENLIEHAQTFDPEKLRAAARIIPKLTVKEARTAFTEAQALLLNAGVVLVFVSEIPNTRISGVSRWLKGTPIIAVTSRYKSLDGLWFTILHEAAHVLLHPKRSTFVDDGSRADDDADAQEAAANKFAEAQLIPPAYRRSLKTINTPNQILSLAETLGISASVVAGQWAFLTGTWGGPIARLRTKVDLAEALL